MHPQLLSDQNKCCFNKLPRGGNTHLSTEDRVLPWENPTGHTRKSIEVNCCTAPPNTVQSYTQCSPTVISPATGLSLIESSCNKVQKYQSLRAKGTMDISSWIDRLGVGYQSFQRILCYSPKILLLRMVLRRWFTVWTMERKPQFCTTKDKCL